MDRYIVIAATNNYHRDYPDVWFYGCYANFEIAKQALSRPGYIVVDIVDNLVFSREANLIGQPFDNPIKVQDLTSYLEYSKGLQS